jgi:hypothetical protein
MATKLTKTGTKDETEKVIKTEKKVEIDYKAEYEKLMKESEALKLTVENNKSEEQEESNGDLNISPSKMINVTNLFYGKLLLEGIHGIISFPTFGVTRPMTFEDISHAQSNARSFAEEGYFYIHDENAVKLLYLEDNYQHFIKKDKIKKILELSEHQIKDLIENTTPLIKESIASMIIDGLVNEKNLEYQNKIGIVGKVLDKDLIGTAKTITDSNNRK